MVISIAGKSIHTDKIVCLTQQCMLHGDIAESKDSLKDYSTKIDFFRKKYLYNFKNTNKAIKDFIKSLT